MPRNKNQTGTSYNPPKYLRIPTDNGRIEKVEVVSCNEKRGKELLLCKICGQYCTTSNGSTIYYVAHRKSKECKRVERKLKEKVNKKDIKDMLIECGFIDDDTATLDEGKFPLATSYGLPIDFQVFYSRTSRRNPSFPSTVGVASESREAEDRRGAEARSV